MPQKIINSNGGGYLEALHRWLTIHLADTLSLAPENIEITVPLTRYGLDSIDAVTMVGDLEEILGVELPSTLFWDYPTVDSAARYLEENINLSESPLVTPKKF